MLKINYSYSEGIFQIRISLVEDDIIRLEWLENYTFQTNDVCPINSSKGSQV